MNKPSQLSLFRSRRFLPLFVTQSMGAFNDNFFKSAMVMLITFRLSDVSGHDPRILVNVAGGVFILPFFLFAALARQLADKYERSLLIQRIRFAEIIIMSGGALAFYLGNTYFLMIILFLMGAQSAFFGPLKYSILPQHLNKDELIAGNGLIQMGTFLSILIGTIFGGLFILSERGVGLVSILVIGVATVGWLSSRHIPKTNPISPDLKISFNIVKETTKIVTDVVPFRDVFFCILGIAWFWLTGATFVAQFTTYARLIIGANEQVATLFLAIFSIGIGLGSMACNSFLKGEITGRYVPWAAMGVSVASVLLFLVGRRPPLPPDAVEIGVIAFLSSWQNLAVLACLLIISFSGGLYIVPLYAIIQARADESRMAGVIACSNVIDSLFMVISAVAAGTLLAMGLEIPHIFLYMAVLAAMAAFFIHKVVR